MQLYNLQAQKERRRALRHNSSPAEYVLWQFLRGRRMQGYKFRRQHGIGPYIVDFYCPAARLVIEVDGDSHFSEEQKKYDARRTHYLEYYYHTVLRFRNDQVLKDTETVVKKIEVWLRQRHHPVPLLN